MYGKMCDENIKAIQQAYTEAGQQIVDSTGMVYDNTTLMSGQSGLH
jgi:hypothetical protein